ncbi:MAG: carboxypeptidase-like regulatory domain-containing protein, partial [Bacteroidia bacterium]
MKKKLLLLLFLFTINSNFIFGQNNLLVKGVVRDSHSGERLQGVSVAIKGSTNGVITDFEGAFVIKVSSLPVVLVVTFIGFEKIELTVSSVSKTLNIKLTEKTKQLRDVNVTDSRITEKQKQAPMTIETMDAVAIKQTSALSFYEGLAQLKGVDMISASLGFNIINTRGFNSTSPVRSLQLIDGVDNQAPGLNFSLGNFLGASELDIQKVDLIVGASSAYFGPNAFNGVINMETKSPFKYPGLSVQQKIGERNLMETSVRWAQVFKDSKGADRFAYKFNLFYMQANDWRAENYDATSQSPAPKGSPGGYDAVNVYGDEYSNARFYKDNSDWSWSGYGYSLRNGYKETDLVDNKTNNLKLSGALHFKPYRDNEIIFTSNFGKGNTIYQGDDRFALRDILFFQNKLEIKKEGKYFLRVYATNENAGNSYDIYSTALQIQNAAKSDNNWAIDYQNYWSLNFLGPLTDQGPWGWFSHFRFDTIFPLNQRGNYIINFVNTYLQDSVKKYHDLAKQIANLYPSSSSNTGVARFEPGTARFDSVFNYITSRTNREGGSKFFDQSALYHVAGEYRFSVSTFDLITGGNFRLYAPYSKGTIYLDTLDNQRIYNREYGVYFGIEKKLLDNNLKLSFTNRLDKNENFSYLYSPAATAVYLFKKNVFRVSVSSALRNPTLTDQYINLNVGRATLLGNLKGMDSLVTIESIYNAFNAPVVPNKGLLNYFNVDPVKPEQVRTIEFGYRGMLSDILYLDASYYYSSYIDFIGYKIGAKVEWTSVFANNVKVYRVATNSKDVVTTQGITVGVNYFLKRYLGFSGNYSWNKLDRHNSEDPLIPAYNTPEHKFNLGVSGRDFNIKIGNASFNHFGYSINFKYQTGFTYEGSPQFTGDVPAYSLV